MSLSELCARCRVSPPVIDRWAKLGAFGPRHQEPRDRGWHRHVTRELAQQAVIMSRLTGAGVREETAAQISVLHRRGEMDDLVIQDHTGIEIVVSRLNLP